MKWLWKFEKAAAISIDISLLFLAYMMSGLLLELGGISPAQIGFSANTLVAMAAIIAAMLMVFKVYETSIRYVGVIDALRLGLALMVSYSAFVLIDVFLTHPVPAIYLANMMMVHILLCGVYRFGIRLLFWTYGHYIAPGIFKSKTMRRVIVVGAGTSGRHLGNMLSYDASKGMHVVAYIDDDDTKWNKKINGIPIVGGRELIPYASRKFRATDIIIAVPRVEGTTMREIFDYCCKTECKVSRYGDLRAYDGNPGKPIIQDFKVEDLLGREEIKLDMAAAESLILGQIVLVTGGAGSIGSEICRQVLEYGARLLLIFDFNENGLFEIKTELLAKYDEQRFVTLLGSVRDMQRVSEVISLYQPDVIFHAAAHKHVPMMELNPLEAINNNVFGTINVAKAASDFGVKRFVLISTDKAVNPTNVMGASKRIAELIIQSANAWGATRFSAVRFGNVLDSNGSVVPLFRKQIEKGGPVTVTHKDVKRYFMTIPEAVQLVLQAGAMAQGGEIFVLDMGQPIKIYDLALAMIRLSGFTPGTEIKIQVVGLRPGEKLFEEISLSDENMTKTANNRIYLLKAAAPDTERLNDQIKKLQKIIVTRDALGLRRTIREIVPTYSSRTDVPLHLAWSRDGS